MYPIVLAIRDGLVNPQLSRAEHFFYSRYCILQDAVVSFARNEVVNASGISSSLSCLNPTASRIGVFMHIQLAVTGLCKQGD